MKKNIQFFFLPLFLFVIWSSCKRIEVEPADWIKDDLVWDTLDKNATVAKFFLNEVYTYLPGGFNRIGSSGNTPGDFLDAGTDDAIPSRNNVSILYYLNGQINVLNNPDPYWGDSYGGIRRANIFLKNIYKVPTVAVNIKNWKAEARFIRAMLYFELLKRYGGVPLIGDTIFTFKDNLQLPRNTFEECVNYLVSECNAVKDSLAVEPISTSEWGKIPRGAAVALKCRVLLYAASPLFNGGGVETDPTLKLLTGYPTYDATRWQLVINAAEELMALGYYNLYSTGTTAFASLFTAKQNVEVILAKQSANNFTIESYNAPIGYGAPAASQGLTSPTQELVDAFPMNSGLPITDASSLYNSADPYTNRDKRLDYTVFHNNSKWLQRNVETFDTGKDKPGGKVVQTRTGYYLRKFMADFSTNSTYTNQSHNFIIFRYAEILLNYAEALNEVGRTTDAVTQIIAIRKRAGITAGSNSRYGIPTGISQADMRELIHNERRIELAFEEHRFWDLRRWKIAENMLNQTLHGMSSSKNADGTFSYSKVDIMNIVFQNRFYHMPLPYNETVKDLRLLQNEGW